MPRYSFADHAQSSTSNEFGNYILKRGAGEIRKPSWQRTETVVRFLPCWDFEGNCWSPFRLSQEPNQYGDWIRQYAGVRGFGANGVTMLLYDHVNEQHYDLQSNPCVLLYRAIDESIKNKTCEADWPALLRGGEGQRAPLSRHQPIYLARAAIFRIKSKDMATQENSPLGLAPTGPAYFLEMPKTVGERLLSTMEERVENYEGDPEDYDAIFKHGDIVSLGCGAYVHIFQEGADPRQEQQQAGGQVRQLGIPTGGGRGSAGGGNKFQGYDLYIERTWRGYSASLNTPEYEQLIRSKQKPWEDCLNFLSNQEQAFLVQDGFPPRAILYAWRDHKDWIKDETRSKATGRVSETVIPVDVPPQGRHIDNPTYAQRPAQARSASTAVGGWGSAAVSDVPPAEGQGPVKDSITPEALDGPSAKFEATNEKEAKALAALNSARARLAGREPAVAA